MIVTVKPHWRVIRVDTGRAVPCDFADTDAYETINGQPGELQRRVRMNFYLLLKPDAPDDLKARFPHLLAPPVA